MRRRAGTPSGACPRRSSRRCRTTAPTPISTSARTCVDEVPQDLYKQDWWYRTTFKAPAGHTTYLLELPGINYRAEVWLNGHQVADNTQIVGMHNAHELDVARWIGPGEPNTLAIKVTPEQALAGHQRGGAGGQLVGLDQLELSGLPGSGQEPRPRQFICLRPECGHLEAGLSQGRRRGVARAPPSSTPNYPCREPIPRGSPSTPSVHNYSTEQVRGVLTGDDHAVQASRASTSSSR